MQTIVVPSSSKELSDLISKYYRRTIKTDKALFEDELRPQTIIIGDNCSFRASQGIIQYNSGLIGDVSWSLDRTPEGSSVEVHAFSLYKDDNLIGYATLETYDYRRTTTLHVPDSNKDALLRHIGGFMVLGEVIHYAVPRIKGNDSFYIASLTSAALCLYRAIRSESQTVPVQSDVVLSSKATAGRKIMIVYSDELTERVKNIMMLNLELLKSFS